MIVNEIFDDKFEYVDPAKDNEVPKLNDLRKTKLTLGDINRMRLVRDIRTMELENSLKQIRKQYGRPPAIQENPSL